MMVEMGTVGFMAYTLFSFLFLCACSSGEREERRESKARHAAVPLKTPLKAIDDQSSFKGSKVENESFIEREAGIVSKEEKRRTKFQEMERRIHNSARSNASERERASVHTSVLLAQKGRIYHGI
jgi:hypothetical protein